MTKDLKKRLHDPEKLHDILLGEGVDTNDLTQDEIDLLSSILWEYRNSGESAIYNTLYEIDYTSKPPSIEEFLESDYYLGAVCRASEEDDYLGMFPCWKKILGDVFAPGSIINQTIYTGAIGTGKTFSGVAGVLYRLAHLFCLRNPILYHGLARGTYITCSIFSITQAQVKRGAFQDMLSMMRLSPFFCEKSKVNIKDKAFADRVIPMVNDVQIEAGSKTHEAIGRNTLISAIDEINFRLEADAAVAAYKLISAIDRRLQSRFKRGNRNPGFLTLISSANQESDFLSTYIKQQQKVATSRVIDLPQWATLDGVPEWSSRYVKLSGKTFTVEIGDSIHPPRILDEGEEVIEGTRTIQVPEEYRSPFDLNLEDSIKDVAGIASGSSVKLFGNMKPLLDSLKDDFKNPFKMQELPLSVGMQEKISDNFTLEGFFEQRGSSLYPKRHPTAPRFIHIDMSTGAEDALGIVCIHPTGLMDMSQILKASSRMDTAIKPVYEMDFALRITRHHGSKEAIDLGEIRGFIYWLTLNNVPVKLVSADLANMSTEIRSILPQVGIETKYQSVDKTKEPYKVLKQVYAERRFKSFLHDYLFLELINLEDQGKKIDHPAEFSHKWEIPGRSLQPSKGSKDLADALAGCVFCAENSEECYSMPTETLVERVAMFHQGMVTSNAYSEAPKDHIPIIGG